MQYDLKYSLRPLQKDTLVAYKWPVIVRPICYPLIWKQGAINIAASKPPHLVP